MCAKGYGSSQGEGQTDKTPLTQEIFEHSDTEWDHAFTKEVRARRLRKQGKGD